MAITVNKDDQVVPSTGLVPDIEVKESISNYGVLGTIEEPMLAMALLAIESSGRFGLNVQGIIPIMDTDTFVPHAQSMYLD